MNANDLMSREPRAVRMGDRLDAVARILWEQDCGAVPVVDAGNVVVGMLTDRDLCMAAYTQGRPLNELPVASAMARSVRTCRPDEAVATVMATMQQHQVHRLPVVDARGVLLGIVSTNDLVRAAQSRPAAVDSGQVVKVLATIGAPRTTATTATTAKVPAPAAGSGPKPAVAATTVAAPGNVVAIKPPADPILPAPGKDKDSKDKGSKDKGGAKPKGRKG